MIDEVEDKVDEQLKNLSSHKEQAKKFVGLMFDEDCRKDEDCDEVISPCCSSEMEIVFGSFPVEVECKDCKTKYLFRDLILE